MARLKCLNDNYTIEWFMAQRDEIKHKIRCFISSHLSYHFTSIWSHKNLIRKGKTTIALPIYSFSYHHHQYHGATKLYERRDPALEITDLWYGYWQQRCGGLGVLGGVTGTYQKEESTLLQARNVVIVATERGLVKSGTSTGKWWSNQTQLSWKRNQIQDREPEFILIFSYTSSISIGGKGEGSFRGRVCKLSNSSDQYTWEAK